jgi:hypothetical protein
MADPGIRVTAESNRAGRRLHRSLETGVLRPPTKEINSIDHRLPLSHRVVCRGRVEVRVPWQVHCRLIAARKVFLKSELSMPQVVSSSRRDSEGARGEERS